MDNTVKKVAVIGCGRISVMHFDGIFAFGNKIKLKISTQSTKFRRMI